MHQTVFSSAAIAPQSKFTELCSSAAVVSQSKSTELCSSAAVNVVPRLNLPRCEVNLGVSKQSNAVTRKRVTG